MRYKMLIAAAVLLVVQDARSEDAGIYAVGSMRIGAQIYINFGLGVRNRLTRSRNLAGRVRIGAPTCKEVCLNMLFLVKKVALI